jgi:rubrerythrin
MATALGGNEVFEMAMGMERVGKDFYEALALGCDNAQVTAFCTYAAREEGRHLATFTQMRDRWAGAARPSHVTPEAAEALTGLAKGRIQPDPAAVHKVAVGGNLKGAIHLAMQMEQDAINFYQALSVHLPGSAKAIEGIVSEEKNHLSRLRAMVV